jgi:prepilin-type N-terminal cleavage/methylation domain-containing protein
MSGTKRPAEAGGFTLVELMIVISIIAILAAIAVPNLLAAKLSANEVAAIGTLRNLNSAQVMVQGAGRIDADNDATGEFGTFLELTGRVGARKGTGVSGGGIPYSDFSTVGTPIRPALISLAMGRVDRNGWVAKSGYLFMIFLPDSGDPSMFVHEENSGTDNAPLGELSATGQFGGGTGKVGLNLSETTWCAYAIPVNRGASGNRAFFVSVLGDVLQSANDVAKHTTATAPVEGRSAFMADNFTSKPAIGTAGRDGDIWKVTN